MPRTAPKWSRLVPGMIAFLALIGLVLWILIFARVGRLRGDTITVYTATSQARGLLKGSNVWLGGQLVGQVNDIRFLGLASDTTDRMLIEMRVLRDYQEYLHRDARAQIRTGGTLLGAPVVHLTFGSPGSAVIRHGDTLRSVPQPDTEGVTSQIAVASRHFPDIARNVRMIGAEIGEASDALGLDDGTGMVQMEVLRRRSTALVRQARGGQGTISRALGDTALAVRARSVIAQTDTLRTLLASDHGVLGRFRRDTTLSAAIADLRAEVSIVRALIDRAEGTAGRALRDAAIRSEVGDAERELGALIEDVKRRPTRYIIF